MALVSIESLQRHTLQILAKTETHSGVELSSYKRNRSIAVTILEGGKVSVRENGYVEQELTVHIKELPKTLKTLIKREFPRSRKVRVHKYSHPSELDRPRKTL